MDEVTEFLETWIEGKDITPFHFKILSGSVEQDREDDRTKQLAFL